MQRFVLILMGLSAVVQSAAAADPPMPSFFDSRDYFVGSEQECERMS